MKSTHNIRIGLLRHHRDKAIRKARWAKEHLQALEQRAAAGEFVSIDDRYAARLRVALAVTKARCNNHSILMWKRIYK